MDKISVRVAVLAAVLGILAFPSGSAWAQSALQGTQIMMGAPAQNQAGASLTVQAVLGDSQGHPISKAVIFFTSQSTFLGRTSDVVLARAVTNAQGQAVATFVDDFSGSATVTAEFRGDAQYAPCNTSVEISTTGGGQVYAEHIGVDLPGFNVPPTGAARADVALSQPGIAGFIASLWPAMNGWPVAAVLLLVWSMYLLAVTFVFRVAAAGEDGSDLPSVKSGRVL